MTLSCFVLYMVYLYIRNQAWVYCSFYSSSQWRLAMPVFRCASRQWLLPPYEGELREIRVINHKQKTVAKQRFAQVGTLRTDLQKSYDCNFCVNFCVNVAHCRKTTIFAIRNCVAFTKVSVNSIIWRKYQNWVALRQNKPYKHYFRKHK